MYTLKSIFTPLNGVKLKKWGVIVFFRVMSYSPVKGFRLYLKVDLEPMEVQVSKKMRVQTFLPLKPLAMGVFTPFNRLNVNFNRS